MVEESNRPRRANLIETWAILAYSYYVTGVACIRVWQLSLKGIKERLAYDAVIHEWAEKVTSKVRIRHKVINPASTTPSSEKPTILMCNHVSLYDIPVSLLSVDGSVRMLSKKELFRFPILGLGMRTAEFISIDRQNRYKAIKDLKIAKEKMESGIVLWIAPEGTRSRNGKLLPFKKGGFHLAIETGAEIIPMGIRGIDNVLPARTHHYHFDMPVEVHIGKAIDASEYALDDKEKLLGVVREEILKLTNQNELLR
ncbi:MAG: lysophospholipid acyltransferase family protein [Pseudomonadota bacterium]